MRAALGTVLAAVVLTAGCAGPATFVSPDPPNDVRVEAWFPKPIERVRGAVADAMVHSRVSIVAGKSTPTLVVGEKPQLPYIGEDAGAPASGPLPVYRVRAALSRRGVDTHVRVSVDPSCPACDGQTLYEWEYPVELVRNILEGTRSKLGGRAPRISYPPRFVPPRRRR
jgi:hypothetical protein